MEMAFQIIAKNALELEAEVGSFVCLQTLECNVLISCSRLRSSTISPIRSPWAHNPIVLQTLTTVSANAIADAARIITQSILLNNISNIII